MLSVLGVPLRGKHIQARREATQEKGGENLWSVEFFRFSGSGCEFTMHKRGALSVYFGASDVCTFI